MQDVISGRFACFNGDVITSLRMEDLLELHNLNGGVGTLALWEVEDPTRFGIVGLDDDQRVTAFKEKPTPEEVLHLINAGSTCWRRRSSTSCRPADIRWNAMSSAAGGAWPTQRGALPRLLHRRGHAHLMERWCRSVHRTRPVYRRPRWTARGEPRAIGVRHHAQCSAAMSRQRAPPSSDQRCSTASASAGSRLNDVFVGQDAVIGEGHPA